MTIDPMKPMYDAEGREWVALRMPDGSVWENKLGGVIVVYGDMYSWTHLVRGLSNTKPQKDCDTTLSVYLGADKHLTKITLHRRNGVLTVEAVNND